MSSAAAQAMSVSQAASLMEDFARRTGLIGDPPSATRRYLWTDAFAVCNFLELARLTRRTLWSELALALVDRVHHTLGRHRADDPRTGWLGGLPEHEGEQHPTRSGLRIGKPLPERGPAEPFAPRLEWERDGQYFHYLTKWMHALDQASRATRRPDLNRWARELAHTAYRAFTRSLGGRTTLAWKMSIDLSRPLVPTMGQHDPLDGLVTYVQLRATASALGTMADGPDLGREIEGLSAMSTGGDYATTDLLGIGGLLMDACHVRQLDHCPELAAHERLPQLLASALLGLVHALPRSALLDPAWGRLAFRELGLAIGLHAVEALRQLWPRESADPEPPDTLAALASYVPLASTIEAFWLDPEHRREAHRDIDEVMLATSLIPDGVVRLHSLP